MDIEAYIEKGYLELFVAGLLTEEENIAICRYANEHPKIKLEIEEIEASVLALSKATSPKFSKKKGFDDLKVRIGQRKDTTVVQLPKKRSNWSTYIAWIMAILLGMGLFYFYTQGEQLKTDMEIVTKENDVLEQQIFEARNSLVNTTEFLNSLRNPGLVVVALEGQQASPEAYAKAYWNKESKTVLIDGLGLPQPPEGIIYQVWSLKLTSPTLTSLGFLENFAENQNKIFSLNNTNESEAFGISLEPIGGGNIQSMDELLLLGTISRS